MILALALVLALLLSSCSTTSRSMTDELHADLPAAQGLGTFTPSCVFLCFVSSEFSQRDARRTDDGAKPAPAPVRSRTKTKTTAKKGGRL